MEFRTQVDIEKSRWQIPPCEKMLFTGSCFADNLGARFKDEQFNAVVNPFGVMYNPVSIGHTVRRVLSGDGVEAFIPNVVVMTLGTNHVYILNETGEIVDNCRKRPQKLFTEKELTVDECRDALDESIGIVMRANPSAHVIITVSPIRYRKYGYHGSQLGKATLLLAIDSLLKTSRYAGQTDYFPAYEIVLDELRDYRFYQPDMLHPSQQAVDYIYERFADTYFSAGTFAFLKEWEPLRQALGHRPFNPDSEEYKEFRHKTMLKVNALSKKYPNFAYQETK